MDLKLLRTFKTVVECGGFSASEVELNIGRSAISRLMSDLETRLDMHLCQRGRSGFQLTEHGKLVYNATQELLLDLEKFRTNINAIHSHLVGELVLSLTDNMVTDSNSPIITALGIFHQTEPEVKISLQVAAPNEVERAVIEGRANLGVVPYHHQLPGLEYHDLHEEQSLLYCGKTHPLFSVHDEGVATENLQEYDFIAPGYSHSIVINERFPELRPAATSFQVEGIATLILSGQYIGFLPSHYANFWLEKKMMRPLLPQKLNYTVPFKVINRKDSQPNLVRSAFLKTLCNHASIE